jgi:quercetin dioxygenase-like cupin family protein
MPDETIVIRRSGEMKASQTRRKGLYERPLLSAHDSLHQNVVLFDAERGMEVEYHAIGTGESLFILAGRHEVQLDDGVHVLAEGDIIYFPPGSKHGMKCIESGEYLAVFAPSKAAL